MQNGKPASLTAPKTLQPEWLGECRNIQRIALSITVKGEAQDTLPSPPLPSCWLLEQIFLFTDGAGEVNQPSVLLGFPARGRGSPAFDSLEQMIQLSEGLLLTAQVSGGFHYCSLLFPNNPV